MLPRKFFEMNIHTCIHTYFIGSSPIWCTLRPNFEKCALTSSHLDDFFDIVTYNYTVMITIFWGGGGEAGHFGGEASTPQIP